MYYQCVIRKKPTAPLPPKLARRAQTLGERLQKARLRRKLPGALVAKHICVSRSTLSRPENGDPSVALATVLPFLSVYGLDPDIDALANLTHILN